MSKKEFRFFRMATERGITTVTFDRRPVNAVSFDVYPEIRELSETIQSSDETRVVVFTAPPDARAWCGGADVNDFLPLDYDTRMARYELINECLPRFFELDRPVIAAINSHSVGVGLVLASFCDIRVVSTKRFSHAPRSTGAFWPEAAHFDPRGHSSGQDARDDLHRPPFHGPGTR